jgi:hypothetical protein
MSMNPTTWTAAKRKAQSNKIKAAWKRRKAAQEQAVIRRKEEWEVMNHLEPMEPAPHLKVMDLKYNPHFEEEVTASDMVNHPAHYTAGKYEVADVADDWYANDPHLWNATKYMARWDKKGDPIENLEKAIWFINRKINKLKEKLGGQ